MMGIKWFSGGKERREAALPIFEELIASMANDSKKEPLKALLVKYRQELKTSGTSTPFISLFYPKNNPTYLKPCSSYRLSVMVIIKQLKRLGHKS